MTLEDEVCGHMASAYEQFQKTQNDMEKYIHNINIKETINNKSSQKKFNKTTTWDMAQMGQSTKDCIRSLTRPTGFA